MLWYSHKLWQCHCDPIGLIRVGSSPRDNLDVFAIVQFPIADLRNFFSKEASGRLPAPSWPPRTALYPQFVRSFGPAVERRRGVDFAWVDEAAYCRANRALRLPNLRYSSESNGNRRHFNCAFRRLLCDGEAVSRVEIGLSDGINTTQIYSLNHESGEFNIPPTASVNTHPLTFLKDIAGLSALVPHGWRKFANKEIAKPRPLILQGRSLAELYYHATSQAQKTFVQQGGEREWLRLVAPGSPVVIVECSKDWMGRLPSIFVQIPESETRGVKVAFAKFNTGFGIVDTWILGSDREALREIRNLRICLLRLHAEQQVLSLVLDRLSTDGLNYQAGSESGDRIENYLNRATRLIARTSWGGIQQSQILAAFDAVEATDKYSSRRTSLEQRLNGMRLQVRRKIERFERRAERTINVFEGATYIEEQNMTQNKIISIGSGATINAPVVVADTIQDSFNTLAEGKLNEDVKKLMDKLLRDITEVAKTAPGKQSKDLAENAAVLSKEVVRDTPRRKWYELSIEGLKEAAEAIGEVGKPILETAGKLLPLLVSLWP